MKNLSGPIELITKSFEIFFKKENLIYFLKIQLPIVFLGLVLFFWTIIFTYNAEGLSEALSTNPFFMFSMVILGIVSGIVGFVVAIASVEAMRRVVDGQPLVIKDAFLVAKSKFWSVVLMRFVVGVITVLGFLLLIVPGVIFSVWYSFTMFEVVLGGSGAVESLSKSKALVSGRFWAVFGRLFTIGVIGFIFGLVLSSIPYRIGSIISPFLTTLFTLPIYLLYRELAAPRGVSEQA